MPRGKKTDDCLAGLPKWCTEEYLADASHEDLSARLSGKMLRKVHLASRRIKSRKYARKSRAKSLARMAELEADNARLEAALADNARLKAENDRLEAALLSETTMMTGSIALREERDALADEVTALTRELLTRDAEHLDRCVALYRTLS